MWIIFNEVNFPSVYFPWQNAIQNLISLWILCSSKYFDVIYVHKTCFIRLWIQFSGASNRTRSVSISYWNINESFFFSFGILLVNAFVVVIIVCASLMLQSVDYSITSNRLHRDRMRSICKKMQMLSIIWHQQRNKIHCMCRHQIHANRGSNRSSHHFTWSVCKAPNQIHQTMSSAVTIRRCISNSFTQPPFMVSKNSARNWKRLLWAHGDVDTVFRGKKAVKTCLRFRILL